MTYEQGEKLKQTEQHIQAAGELNQKRLERIESLSAREDSLKQLVDTLRTELKNLKKSVVENEATIGKKRK